MGSPVPSSTDRLRAVTVRLDRDLPVRQLGARSGLLWSRDGLVLAGLGRATELELSRPGGFAAASAQLAALEVGSASTSPGPAVSGAVAFAALPFDPDEPGCLIVPEVTVGVDRSGHRWATLVGPDPGPGPDRELSEVLAQIDGLIGDLPDADARDQTEPEPSAYRLDSVLAAEWWRDEIVARARDRILAGELDKAVLARELVLATDAPIRPEVVIERLHAVFPQAMLFLVDGFVGASPELLVSRRDDVVRAHPLAGTAARASDPAIDQRRIAELLASDKDRWEHRVTIDWLLDNLLPFCSYVDAEPEPSVMTMANVHHFATLVEGRLSSPPAPVLELVAALHPTPALGGSPQKDALALIAELEQTDRGRYGGPVGWVDSAGNGEFAVGIRSAQLDGNQARFFAGVGVVAGSDPEAELAETRAKFRAMLGALIVP